MWDRGRKASTSAGDAYGWFHPRSAGLVKPVHPRCSQRARPTPRTCLWTHPVTQSHSHVCAICRYQCFKSAWMFEVFHRGFSFPVNYRNLKTALQVYDKEVQWTLGAILYRTRFLPLRYGWAFGNENPTEDASLHPRHGGRWGWVFGALLALAVGRMGESGRSDLVSPPEPPPFPAHHPSRGITKVLILNCLFPSPCTEGSIPGPLTFMALDPFSKSYF